MTEEKIINGINRLSYSYPQQQLLCEEFKIQTSLLDTHKGAGHNTIICMYPDSLPFSMSAYNKCYIVFFFFCLFSLISQINDLIFLHKDILYLSPSPSHTHTHTHCYLEKGSYNQMPEDISYLELKTGCSEVRGTSEHQPYISPVWLSVIYNQIQKMCNY